jgi:hypothetical protein
MESSENQSVCLYRRALGSAFDELSPTLIRFHSLVASASAIGILDVTRGAGWFRHAAANLMHLPEEGKRVRVSLSVEAAAGEECWTRHFGRLKLITYQWMDSDLLNERSGPMRFAFRLIVEEGAMRFSTARVWLLGIPLPQRLSPRVNATATAFDEGWWVRVRVDVPTLGMLVQYEGKIVQQC